MGMNEFYGPGDEQESIITIRHLLVRFVLFRAKVFERFSESRASGSFGAHSQRIQLLVPWRLGLRALDKSCQPSAVRELAAGWGTQTYLIWKLSAEKS